MSDTFDPSRLDADTLTAIRWHLTDLAYKAPEVARNRAFTDLNGNSIRIFANGTVWVNGLRCEVTL